MTAIIETRFGKYFLNGIPQTKEFKSLRQEIKIQKSVYGTDDYPLAQRKMFFFNERHLHEGHNDIACLRGIFSRITQPTEAQVRKAMILSIDNDYKLKAGGGSSSDSIFSSSLSYLIAHPITGLDTNVVLIKKYSTVFSDVLISIDEIEELWDHVKTDDQKKEEDLDSIQALVYFMARGVRCGNISTTKGVRPYTSADETLILKRLNSFDPASVDSVALKAIQREEANLNVEIIEDFPGVNKNQQHQQQVRERLTALNQVGAKIRASRVECVQGSLFAAA